jgi:phosphoserine aminotransferase
MMSKIHNFSAGPAILPPSAIAASIQALQNFSGTGLSLIEVSHRSKEFEAVVAEAVQLIKDILKIGEEYAVIFMQGGASTQFDLIPMNWLGEGETAAYSNTGVWASRSIKEAKVFGNVNVVASSEDKNFNYIPKGYTIPADSKYYHYTTNNTIYGTEVFDIPETNGIPLICDMSSDIFSRPFDAHKFYMIYAGAQKNMGPAGTTLVIIKKSFLEKRVSKKLPTMFDYAVHIENGSMYNTPSVFPIFVCMHTLRWIKEIGLEAMEKRNKEKADLLYAEIDRNPLFVGTVAKEDRSRMNVNFVLNNKDYEAEFLQLCENKNLSGLKGHRSVGGLRASLYNALELESVQALVDTMKEFESTKK